MFGICNLSVVPCRAEPSNKSEMVTQLLFGEHFTISQENEEWVKIKNAYDDYECWINHKQYSPIKEKTFLEIQKQKKTIATDLLTIVKNPTEQLTFPVPMGSSFPFFSDGKFCIEERSNYSVEPSSVRSIFDKNLSECIPTALQFLNTPYLWGGRTCMGIDCSGFTQLVFALHGIKLPRDAYQQAEFGEALSFVEESKAGDLAFFDNEVGKITHVGIVMNNAHIIHASGKVRIDKFDHHGIFQSERKKYSHQLRVIKRFSN